MYSILVVVVLNYDGFLFYSSPFILDGHFETNVVAYALQQSNAKLYNS